MMGIWTIVLQGVLLILPGVFFFVGYRIGKSITKEIDGYLHVIDVGEEEPELLLDINSLEAVNKPIVTLQTVKGALK